MFSRHARSTAPAPLQILLRYSRSAIDTKSFLFFNKYLIASTLAAVRIQKAAIMIVILFDGGSHPWLPVWRRQNRFGRELLAGIMFPLCPIAKSDSEAMKQKRGWQEYRPHDATCQTRIVTEGMCCNPIHLCHLANGGLARTCVRESPRV